MDFPAFSSDMLDPPLHHADEGNEWEDAQQEQTSWPQPHVLLEYESSKVISLPRDIKDLDNPTLMFNRLRDLCLRPILLGTECLRLSSLHLNTLPLEVVNLPFLNSLELHNNNMQPEAVTLMANLPNLKSVTLSMNNLKVFPWQLKTLHHLEILGVGANLIPALPDFVSGDFPALKFLRLGNNLLKVLPESIAVLTSLETIILYRNSLTELPESLAALPRLQALDVQSNPGLIRLSPALWERSQTGDLTLLTSLPNQLIPGLFIGDWEAAHNSGALQALQIGHVLSICDDTPTIDKDLFDHVYLDLQDSGQVQISSNFAECFEFISRHKTTGKGVLVHCAAGVSRSATVCIAYIMKEQRLSLKETLVRVRKVRPIISPNFGFMAQLEAFEATLSS